MDNTKEFDLNKHSSNSSKSCVLKVDLEYPKTFFELHNDFPLAPDKVEIKREMLSLNSQKLLICIIFLLLAMLRSCWLIFLIKKEKYLLHYGSFQL